MSETAGGRAVVHPVHGAGRITDHVERGGREFVVFVPLAAPGGLTVLVPRERAGEHLREVGEADAALAVLDSQPDIDTLEAHWRRRVATYRARLEVGLTGVAAAVRDLREARRRDEAAGRARSWLSSTEHRLLAEAEHLLAAELAAAQGKSLDEIEAWLAA